MGVVADRAALVVIDVQGGMVEGFEDDWEDVMPVIADLLKRARRESAPVVLVQHCGRGPSHPLNETAGGWALHGSVDPQPGDLRVRKVWSDSFQGTDLHDLLRARTVTQGDSADPLALDDHSAAHRDECLDHRAGPAHAVIAGSRACQCLLAFLGVIVMIFVTAAVVLRVSVRLIFAGNW